MSEDLYFDIGWIIRDNCEFDEKLPSIARNIIENKIDYGQINRSDTLDKADKDIVQSIMEIMIDHLDSFCEMTNDEIESAIETLVIVCEFIVVQKELEQNN